MRHLTFYYAIGFAIAGAFMVAFGFSVINELFWTDNGLVNLVVLSFGMILPFAISALSWRDWGELQKNKEPYSED